MLIPLLFGYYKFERNILCSTRLSGGLERARMSHAVNLKIPNTKVHTYLLTGTEFDVTELSAHGFVSRVAPGSWRTVRITTVV